MSYALVASVSAAPGINGGTTGSIDTTGADLLIVVIAEFDGGTHTAPSDSKGNTWLELTTQADRGAQSTVFYAVNPTVGSGHTFTYAEASTYPAISAMAFSGANTSSPFDVENGATAASGTSIQPGSVTPNEDDELLVSGVCADSGNDTGMGIDSSFLLELSDPYGGGNNMGGYAAYKIQTTAGAENPTWSWTGGNLESTAVIATFKAAAAPAAGNPWYYYTQQA